MRRNNKIDSQKEEIIALYKEGKTYKELAIIFEVSPSVISTRMRSWGANNSDSNRFKRVLISRDSLYDMYWNKEMHPREISKIFGCSITTIHNNLKKYNIPTRTKSEARIGKLNPIYGVGHSIETRKKMSRAFVNGRKIGLHSIWGKIVKYETPNQGVVTMRSTWEASTADYLTHNNFDWYYEVTTFKLSELLSYRPDFYLPELNLYIEVKGLLFDTDIKKIELFRSLGYILELWDKSVLLEKGIIDKYGRTSYLK